MADSEVTSAGSSSVVETVDLASREDTEEQEGRSPSSSVPSSANTPSTLLSILHAAQPSNLMRPHKVKRNPPVEMTLHIQTSRDPKSISPKQQLKEFPEEALTVSADELFCTACREELALKATVLKLHFQSRKHKDGKERLRCKDKWDMDIAEAFSAYSNEEHVVGETLSRDAQVYRVKVVTTFLKAGVPLNKLETFRELLEKNGL